MGISKVTGTQTFRIPIGGVHKRSQKRLLQHQGGNFRSEGGAVCQEVDVPVYRLDDLQHGPVGFIKIDVEVHVIEGAKNLIQRDKPVLMLELYQSFHQPNILDLVQQIEALGYEAKVIHGSKYVHPTTVDTDCLVIDHEKYIKNFLFFPA